MRDENTKHDTFKKITAKHHIKFNVICFLLGQLVEKNDKFMLLMLSFI